MNTGCYGLLAEFASSQALLDAVVAARGAGYRKLEAYTPYFVEGLAEALALPRSRIPLLTLFGGMLGGVLGFFVQWYSAVVDYPIDSGGRPLNSWPMFIPATFETTVLGAALAAFIGMLMLNRLPQLRHPLFDVPDFDLVSRNRFFFCIRGSDPAFEPEHTHAWLETLAPLRVTTVRAASERAS